MIFLLIISLAGGVASAQERVVTLSSQSISVRDALKQIEAQTNYLFAIGHSNFDMSRVTVLGDNRATVKALLGELLKDSGRTYTMDGNHILIIPDKLEKKEAEGMVVLPFDWSRSYNDEDFHRDADMDAERREAKSEKERQQQEERKIEVTIITDSIFTYPSYSFTIPPVKALKWIRVRDGRLHLALKTNVLWGALAFAPNIGAEVSVSPRSTIDLAYGANYWNKKGSYDDNKKLIHWYLRPEYRYWLCGAFDGHFFGAHAFYWQYNVSRHKIPLLFDKDYQYEGNAFGFGLSYGYHLMLNRKWGLEFNAGVGVAFMNHDKYGCAKCGDWLENADKTYFGPTSLGIKLVYMIK